MEYSKQFIELGVRQKTVVLLNSDHKASDNYVNMIERVLEILEPT